LVAYPRSLADVLSNIRRYYRFYRFSGKGLTDWLLLLQAYEGMKQREAKIPPEGKIRLTEAPE
jgi:hypothetical protein